MNNKSIRWLPFGVVINQFNDTSDIKRKWNLWSV